ncbi:MAG: phosphoribosylanthranilate isomerase [Candidatus Aureabacteria bacterium]|nr:phosphoribosylanthranilate isomerase [Candidatus Auribacterota bacterium]
MVKVKICGITNRDDAHAAVHAGADALGFVFAPSPRRVAPERAREIIGSLPLFVSTVGVFVDEDPASVREVVSFCNLRYIQFHGDEPPEICNAFGDRAIKAVQIKDEGDLRGLERYHVSAFLLDSHVAGRRGGTGTSFPWELAARVGSMGRSVILSGGLNSGNVAQAIRIAAPYAVDVSSGVESEPGKKDPALVREFIRIAKTDSR